MKPAYTNLFIKRLPILLFAILLTACSLEKKSWFNRNMQNLTAHYNVLFNAREILREKQDTYAAGFVDNYNELLSVYQDTAIISGEDKELDAAAEKAFYIVNFKEQSNYLDDAYLVIGKSHYLSKEYFNALEYFDYILRSYTGNPEIRQETQVWKARTLMRLNHPDKAAIALDSAMKNINPKKNITADVYATQLQYDINRQEYEHAEEMAAKAIEYGHSTQQKLRWRFILAQLQELNQKPAEAVENYTRIVKSNAPFEMAFNADLNRIRIEDIRDGVKISRINKLKRLLRNQNNDEFKDQIYYQIAEILFLQDSIDRALENYKLSTKFSKQNQNQKGISYLRQADIYFKIKTDYVSAKKYYDSTLLNLAVTYPGYAAIKNKTDNLQQLTNNLDIIAREDTLQTLAALDEKARAAKIDEMVESHTIKRQQDEEQATLAATTVDINNTINPQASTPTGGNFYFYSNAAVSSGMVEFKRRWGNRRLEDDWRRSQRANSNLTINNAQNPNVTPGINEVNNTATALSAGNYRQQLEKDIPLTPDMLAASKTRMFNAYFDIANFYRDIIGDKKEAITAYDKILNRFPDNPNKAAIYYSLYRLYSTFDMAKADVYKNKLLTEFKGTPYAKVILDPEYAKHINDADAELNALYNEVYDLYAQRKYADAMQQIDVLMQQFPGNKLSAQLYYLRALANGRQVKLAPFKTDLIEIAKQYPDNRLITPLVNQHLQYIQAHNAEIAARRFAIIDTDPDYIPFMVDEVAPMVSRFAEVADERVERDTEGLQAAAPAPAKTVTQDVLPPNTTINPQTQQVNTVKTGDIAKPKKTYIFNESDNTNYYFVINVATNTINLSSSRFGIGQFNRTRYQGVPIKHQLKAAGINRLIYVGKFNSLNDAKEYGRGIVSLLPEIMKVPQDKYSFFIITQQNLDKLANAKLLDDYIEYYEDNF